MDLTVWEMLVGDEKYVKKKWREKVESTDRGLTNVVSLGRTVSERMIE